MSFSMEAPEDLGAPSDYMHEPGTFHFVVSDIREGKMANGEMLRNGGFSVELTARTGNEVDKKINLNFNNGDLTHKDKGEFARRKQASFLVASNLITPDQLGKRIDVELKNAIGHQVVAELELEEPNDKGKQYLNLRFSNIFHVDDPRVSVAKSEPDLKMIPEQFRRKPEFFDALLKKPSSNGSKPKVEDKDFEGL